MLNFQNHSKSHWFIIIQNSANLDTGVANKVEDIDKMNLNST